MSKSTISLLQLFAATIRPPRPPVQRGARSLPDLQGLDRMTDKIREILDAATARVFAYQPADKAIWAKSAKERKSGKDDGSKLKPVSYCPGSVPAPHHDSRP